MNDEKTILMVDDSADDVMFLKFVLKEAGVLNPVVVSHDGVEAVCYLKGEGFFADREKYPLPSILFLDLKMPNCDGFQILDWLQQQPHLRSMLIVVLTGDWEMRGINRAYQLGAHSFLVKPCQSPDITNLIKAFPGHWMISPSTNPKQDATGF
jgi:CheY-like chemotaxis protein